MEIIVGFLAGYLVGDMLCEISKVLVEKYNEWRNK